MMRVVIWLVRFLVSLLLVLTWRVVRFTFRKLPLLWKFAKWVYRLIWPRIERPTHGDARWATDKDLEKAGRFEPDGIRVCQTKSGKQVFTDQESSLLIMGEKGMGKTLTIISIVLALKLRVPRPTEIRTEKGLVVVDKLKLPDLLISDPKNSVFNATKDDLQGLGYKIVVLDIANPGDARMDPFGIFRVNDDIDLTRQVKSFSKLLSQDAKHGKHDHFDNYPRIMIRGVIKYLLKKRPDEATLHGCVRYLIASKKLRERLFREMEEDDDPMISGAVEAYNSAGDREMGSFITSNFEKMEYWLNPAVKRITEHPRKEDGSIDRGWTWENMFDSEEPVAVFIRAGFGTEEGELVRLYMGCAINSARRRFNETGKALRKGLWVIVDEALTLGHCDAIAQVNREMREAGVNLIMGWLTFEDLKATYPQYKNLVAGSDTLTLGTSDVEWNQHISKLLGKRTAMSKSESESDRSKGKGAHEQGVNLLNDDEIPAKPFRECVAILRSRNGIMKIDGLKPFIN